jgi:hypothetical protein
VRRNLAAFLRRTLIGSVFLSAGRAVIRVVLFVAAAAVAAGLLDLVFDFSRGQRLGLWGVLAVASFLVAASGFWPFKIFTLPARSRQLAQRTGSLFRLDELILIQQFLGQPAVSSPDLSEAYLERVAGRLERQSPLAVYPPYPWGRRGGGAALALLVFALAVSFLPEARRSAERVLWPFRSFDMEAFVRVTPGDAEVPWGGRADIAVACLAPSLEKPVLKVKAGRHWNPVAPKNNSGDMLEFSLDRLTEPVIYRVDWNGESSRRYRLTPVKPIAVTAFDITLTPPAYTGEEPVKMSEPSIAALPGSKVDYGIEISQPVEATRLTPPEHPPLAGRPRGATSSLFSFVAEKPGFLSIEGQVGGVWRPLGDRYALTLRDDKAPSVTLLSPEQDLVLGERERLPITYEASDDVGLGSAALEWQRSGEAVQSREIQRFEPGRKSALSTFDWDVPQEKFRAGEFVRYRVTVFDRNTVTGPGRASTPWRSLELRSFEQAHQNLEKELEAWRGEVLDALANANTLRKKLDKESPTPAEQAQSGRDLAGSTHKLEEKLERLVSHMEADPLADYSVWMEHRSMEDNLSAMNRSLLPDIQNALNNQQKSAASARLGDLSAELERMAALSEDLSKRQKARDVQESGEDLSKTGDDLEKELSQAAAKGSLSEADKKKLNSLLADAQKALQDIARSLQQMPQELPEDFVNQDALKKINLAQSQDALSKIQEALARGDVKGALAMAQQFRAQVQSMRDQIGKAHQEYEKGRSAETMSKTMSAEQQKLDQIAKDQMDVLAKTQALEAKRMEAAREKQKNRLKELAVRQQQVLRRADGVIKAPGVEMGLRVTTQSLLPPMTSVLAEFTQGRVEKSPETLEAIIRNLRALVAPVSSSTAAGVSDLSWITGEETAIRDELKKPIPEENVFNADDRARFSELEKKQSALRGDTSGLRTRLQKLSRQTATLGLPLTGALEKAAEAMGQAGKSLSENSSGPAYRSEEEALQDLMEAQSAMEQASGMASQMAEQEGGSGGGPARRMRVMRSGGGSSGVQNAPVRIPTAEDYRPPAAFREELLKSLKEKYPEIYDDVVHKYYRRLTE